MIHIKRKPSLPRPGRRTAAQPESREQGPIWQLATTGAVIPRTYLQDYQAAAERVCEERGEDFVHVEACRRRDQKGYDGQRLNRSARGKVVRIAFTGAWLEQGDQASLSEFFTALTEIRANTEPELLGL